MRSFIFLILFAPCILMASNLTREARIAEQIQDAILDGEVIWLDSNGQAFLGIYTRGKPESLKGAVIILHGKGANPDWLDVIQPLRTGLPEKGWDTLSIQMPVAAAGAPDSQWEPLVTEAAPRIDAALAFLKEQKVFNIFILGHSLGARMGAEYLAGTDIAKEIRGLIMLSVPTDRKAKTSKTLGALRKIELPMLDIYGSRDFASILDSSRARKLAAVEEKTPLYRQIQIEGADHFYRGLEADLLAIVKAWLVKTSTGYKPEEEDQNEDSPGPATGN